MEQHSLNDDEYSKQTIFAVVSSFVTLVGYYIPGCFFVLADKYRFLDAYAIRSGKHRVPPQKLTLAAIKEATLDTFIVKPLLFYFLFPLFETTLSFGEFPSVSVGFTQWIIMEVSFSITFYIAHRLLHNSPFLYKHIHKVHHTFHESIGFAGQYSHPVENVMGGLHLLIAVLIVRPHVTVFWINLFTRYVEIVDAHSGYEVPWRVVYPWASCYPWACGASVHDFHHSHNRGAYGGGILSVDKLLGTDQDYRDFLLKKKTRIGQELR